MRPVLPQGLVRSLCALLLVLTGVRCSSPTSPSSPAPTNPSPTGNDAGLVAFYPFTGNVNDASGRGQHGVVASGATLTADRHGVPNAAYEFNGAGEINAPITLRSSSMSAAAWIRPRSSQCWGGIFDAYPEQWEFVTDCVNGDRLELAEWRSRELFFDRIDNARLTPNRWTHVAVTVSGLSGQFYVDGAATSTFTLSAPLLTQPTRLYIGHSKSGTSQYFSGALDELRLYDTALGASAVRSLYEATR